MSFDFDAAVTAPFRMQPGLRRMAHGAKHVTPVPPGSRHQREKLAVLSAFPASALLCQPGFDATAALATLAAQAAAEHPQAWSWDGRRATARWLQVSVDGDAVLEEAPGTFGLGNEIGQCLRRLPAEWRLAGLLSLAFAEDFAVLRRCDATVTWLAVCLPSHWAPEEKIGRPLAEVHGPVADGERLREASAHLAHLVSQTQRWERFVWTVAGHPRLHAHPLRTDRPAQAGLCAEAVPLACWWRTERQTFIPVAGEDQAVFTILVEVTPLATAIDSPARAQRLQEALTSMSDAALAYRHLTAARPALLAWLAERSRSEQNTPHD